jgi:hypothetical protein
MKLALIASLTPTQSCAHQQHATSVGWARRGASAAIRVRLPSQQRMILSLVKFSLDSNPFSPMSSGLSKLSPFFTKKLRNFETLEEIPYYHGT